MIRGASTSRDGRYRWSLWRRWEEGSELLVIGLNPSTADATQDDPTLRRCMGFARRWGHGGVRIVNLFALRATDPRALRQVERPEGRRNRAAIREAVAQADQILAAWGNPGSYLDQDRRIRKLLPTSTVCFGLTKQGQPRHPLYVPYGTPLIRLQPPTTTAE